MDGSAAVAYSDERSRVTESVAADFSANEYVPAAFTDDETSNVSTVSLVLGSTEPAAVPLVAGN